MNTLRKAGGIAALYEALAYVIGMVGFLVVINLGDATDPVEKMNAIAANQAALTTLMLIVYVVWGATLVVLTLSLHQQLKGEKYALAQIATAFGLIWSVLVIASGMIYNVGLETVVGLAESNPAEAATVWTAIESIFNGLGGGVEVVGGIWVVLLSIAALRHGGLPRPFSIFGLVVGGAGLITVIPALGEIGGAVFGLTQIVWFAWLGVVLLRRPNSATEEVIAPAMG
ncbi:MAG: DUF4386 family protein [Chloroflexota bacterium]